MDDLKREEIEKLSGNLFDAKQRLHNLQIAKIPTSDTEKRQAEIEFSLAKREVTEANRALKAALNE
jgi:hypothetical protein